MQCSQSSVIFLHETSSFIPKHTHIIARTRNGSPPKSHGIFTFLESEKNKMSVVYWLVSQNWCRPELGCCCVSKRSQSATIVIFIQPFSLIHDIRLLNRAYTIVTDEWDRKCDLSVLITTQFLGYIFNCRTTTGRNHDSVSVLTHYNKCCEIVFRFSETRQGRTNWGQLNSIKYNIKSLVFNWLNECTKDFTQYKFYIITK